MVKTLVMILATFRRARTTGTLGTATRLLANASALGLLAMPTVWAAPLALPSPLPSAASLSGEFQEFEDDFERDYLIRTHGELQITNTRGDITVQGWPLDRIRVRATRRAQAITQAEAQTLFKALDFRFSSVGSFIELAAEYGKGLTIEQRLQEREQPRTEISMVVWAPSHLKLRLWAVDGAIKLKNWNSPVEARTARGDITLEDVKSGGVSVLCPACAIRLRAIRGPIRCMGGTGSVTLKNSKSKQVYVETSRGSISADGIIGEQLYVSKEGAVRGRALGGVIEFHTQSAPVEIVESAGFLSGNTVTGSILARMREWDFADKAVIESAQGNIQLMLPHGFSGEMDIGSLTGKVDLGFPIETGQRPDVVSAPRHRTGRVGDGGELLRVFSRSGDVQVAPGG